MINSTWMRIALFCCLVVVGGAELALFVFFVGSSKDFIVRNHNAAAVQFGMDHAIVMPSTLDFREGSIDLRRLGDGWHKAGRDGVWSSSTEAWVELELQRSSFPVEMSVDATVRLSQVVPQNTIAVIVNGTTVATLPRNSTNASSPIELTIPPDLVGSRRLEVLFRLDYAESPLREGVGRDPMRRGILLKRIELRTSG